MRRMQCAARVAGGFELVRAGQLTEAWDWYNAGLIELADLRVFFACIEMRARRCGAEVARFELEEITRLTTISRPRAALARLQAAGLLRFSEDCIEILPPKGRLVPFPRRMLRHLARCRKPSVIAAVLGHLLRCLFYAEGKCRTFGRCKASDLSKLFGIDLRRIKAARAELVALGWLVPEAEEQWVLNRWGGSFRINLAWGKLPPPPATDGTPLPPPDSDKHPLLGSKNQEPPPTGVSLKDIQPEDLKDTARTLELHAQAVEAGLVTDCEADRLKVVAAAEHARSVGTTNPSGLFASILRRGLFSHLTQDDEDAARRRIREHLFAPALGGPPRTPCAKVQGPPPAPDDALIAREVIAAARRAGYRGDPYLLVRREDPSWTRARWEDALAPTTSIMRL